MRAPPPSDPFRPLQTPSDPFRPLQGLAPATPKRRAAEARASIVCCAQTGRLQTYFNQSVPSSARPTPT
eukprot:9114045-Pyramimonas_sp.AAC.1